MTPEEKADVFLGCILFDNYAGEIDMRLHERVHAMLAQAFRETKAEAYEESVCVTENVEGHYADEDVRGACFEVVRRLRALKDSLLPETVSS